VLQNAISWQLNVISVTFVHLFHAHEHKFILAANVGMCPQILTRHVGICGHLVDDNMLPYLKPAVCPDIWHVWMNTRAWLKLELHFWSEGCTTLLHLNFFATLHESLWPSRKTHRTSVKASETTPGGTKITKERSSSAQGMHVTDGASGLYQMLCKVRYFVASEVGSFRFVWSREITKQILRWSEDRKHNVDFWRSIQFTRGYLWLHNVQTWRQINNWSSCLSSVLWCLVIEEWF
jgi:hypothetical protein